MQKNAPQRMTRRAILVCGTTAVASTAMASHASSQTDLTVAQRSPAGERPKPSRTILAQGLPAATPGWELSLRRVTFAPGVAIPGEIHPGMQIVYIVSGTLNLKVLGGEARVQRAQPDGSQGTVETFKASPTEIALKAGDTVLESETLVLAPRNAGREPLVILAASLLPVGQPQSIDITQNIIVNPPSF